MKWVCSVTLVEMIIYLDALDSSGMHFSRLRDSFGRDGSSSTSISFSELYSYCRNLTKVRQRLKWWLPGLDSL